MSIYSAVKNIIFNKNKDWKGYSVLRKSAVLMSFSIWPLKIWQKYPQDVIRSLELSNVDICNDKVLMDFIIDLKYRRCKRSLMTIREMLNLYKMVKKTDLLPGAIAEVGVYRGGSAAILAHYKGNRPLFLFDTFEGLPYINKEKDILLRGEMSDTSEQLVMNLLSGYSNYTIFKGIFPDETGIQVADNEFSLVHLDTDLYDATFQSLSFFYPKTQKGGIIITHDYNDLLTPGVRVAFDSFFTDKPEKVIEIWDTHALVVKQ